VTTQTAKSADTKLHLLNCKGNKVNSLSKSHLALEEGSPNSHHKTLSEHV